jgi:hypothetical protein
VLNTSEPHYVSPVSYFIATLDLTHLEAGGLEQSFEPQFQANAGGRALCDDVAGGPEDKLGLDQIAVRLFDHSEQIREARGRSPTIGSACEGVHDSCQRRFQRYVY